MSARRIESRSVNAGVRVPKNETRPITRPTSASAPTAEITGRFRMPDQAVDEGSLLIGRRGACVREPGKTCRARAGSRGHHRPLAAAEIGEHVRGALISQAGVLLHRPLDHVRDLRRNHGVELVHRHGVAIQDRVERHCGVSSRKCALTGRHLVEHAAEREQIRPRVEHLAARLLRRHVGDRTDVRARSGQSTSSRLDSSAPTTAATAAGVRMVMTELRDAEVQHLELPARG